MHKMLTASKDGTIYIWSLGNEHEDEDYLNYVADQQLDEPLTRAKWLTEKTILVTTTFGNLYALQLSKDDQGVECLLRPKLLYTAEHAVAIWDLQTYSAGASCLQIWLAEDSGKVMQLNLENEETLQITSKALLHVSKQEY